MLTINTRQNSKGNWWCNTTWNGEDISVEGKTTDKAQLLMINELANIKCSEGRWAWTTIKPYNKKVTSKMLHVTYTKSIIDNNPIA